jgi:hypothetical protein
MRKTESEDMNDQQKDAMEERSERIVGLAPWNCGCGATVITAIIIRMKRNNNSKLPARPTRLVHRSLTQLQRLLTPLSSQQQAVVENLALHQDEFTAQNPSTLGDGQYPTTFAISRYATTPWAQVPSRRKEAVNIPVLLETLLLFRECS